MLIREAVSAWHAGDSSRARELAEESLALSGGSPREEGEALYVLGNVAYTEGRGDEALELLARSAELCRLVGFEWFAVGSLLNYADYALRLGRPGAAAEPLRDVVGSSRSMGDRQHAVYGLALLARLATEQGDLDRAGRLWGAVEAEAERAPVGQWEVERDEYAGFVVRDDPAFERGRAAGRRLTFDQAVDEALAQPE
jgi:tetratricopeptide (TPR) repeat protein